MKHSTVCLYIHHSIFFLLPPKQSLFITFELLPLKKILPPFLVQIMFVMIACKCALLSIKRKVCEFCRHVCKLRILVPPTDFCTAGYLLTLQLIRQFKAVCCGTGDGFFASVAVLIPWSYRVMNFLGPHTIGVSSDGYLRILQLIRQFQGFVCWLQNCFSGFGFRLNILTQSHTEQ